MLFITVFVFYTLYLYFSNHELHAPLSDCQKLKTASNRVSTPTNQTCSASRNSQIYIQCLHTMHPDSVCSASRYTVYPDKQCTIKLYSASSPFVATQFSGTCLLLPPQTPHRVTKFNALHIALQLHFIPVYYSYIAFQCIETALRFSVLQIHCISVHCRYIAFLCTETEFHCTVIALQTTFNALQCISLHCN